jgi:Flp pilus assembly protein protease CpaA
VAQTLIALPIIILSIAISLIDIKEHRIYNTHLLIFALPLLFQMRPLPFLQTFMVILSALTLSISLGIGGGDFKLFSLLLLAQGQLLISREYFQLLALCIGASLLLSSMLALKMKQRLVGSIPLAPSILAPFVAIYLDI